MYKYVKMYADLHIHDYMQAYRIFIQKGYICVSIDSNIYLEHAAFYRLHVPDIMRMYVNDLCIDQYKFTKMHTYKCTLTCKYLFTLC